MRKNYTFLIIIILIFISSFISNDIFAQKRVYLGVKGGSSFSKTTRSEYTRTTHGEYSFDNPARFGLNPSAEVGIIANLPINDSISIQPEILLVKKGYQAFGVYDDVNGRADSKSYEQWVNTYIEVPLMAKLALGNEKIKFFFAAGPSISLQLKSSYNRRLTSGEVVREDQKVEYKYRQTTPKVIGYHTINDKKYPIEAKYDSITVKTNPEVSLAIGTGLHYKVGNSMLIFDIRYVYGLSDIYKYLEDTRPLNYQPGVDPVKQPAKTDEHYRRFAVSIGYLFSFKK